MNTRTSVFRSLAIVSLSALAFAACDNKTETPVTPKNTQVSITPSSATLSVGQTATFVASVSDDTTGANSGVTYTSTNTAVATVATNGVVTAVAPGTTTIIATSKFNANRAAAAIVTVTTGGSAITVAVVPTQASIPAGTTLQLVPAVSGTTNIAVTYTTSDATVATVSSTGLVTATQKNGTAVITVTSSADATKTAAAVIIVTNGQITGTAVVSITPTPLVAVNAGDQVTFTATVTGVANTAKTFSSSDTTVATINATTGVATAKNKSGSTTITATSTADPTKTATTTLTVTRPAVTVSATPATFQLSPGGTQQITPALTGSAADIAAGVTCVSSDTTIAKVTSPGCIVTAVAQGNATITVKSVADNTKTASVVVSVANVIAPSLSIQSVTDAAGNPLASGATVSGNVIVTINVGTGSQSSIQRVAARLNGVEACSRTFTPPLAPTPSTNTIQCTINTAQLNSTTGAPLFTNGTYALTADAFSTTNSVAPVATATFGNLTLNNTNSVNGVVTYDNSLSDTDNTPAAAQAVDGTGNLWNGGSATVVVTPAIFSGSQAATVDVIMDLGCDGTADATKTATVGANGSATATFSEADALAANGNDDVTNPTVCYEVGNARAANNTSVTLPVSSGTGGVSTVGTPAPTPVNRVDNVEPGAFAPTFSGTFTGNNNFAGANTAFTSGSSAITGGTATDVGGVGGITYSFFAVPAGTDVSSPDAMRTAVTGKTAVTSASQLTGTPTNSAYILIERAMDALGNTSYATVGSFGVDLVGPTLTTSAGSIANNSTSTAANPGTQVINVSATDSISGVAQFKARISGRRTNNTATTTLTCYNNTGAVIAAVSGVCPFTTVPATGGTTTATATINIPAVDNFYTVDVQSVDRAGNTSSSTVSLNELRDTTVPTAAITSTTVTGNAVSITGNVSDNVDLRGYDMRFRFTGLTTIPTDVPFTPLTVVDSYGLPLTGLVNGVNGSNNTAVRALTEGATLNIPTSLGFGVADVAGNYGTAMQAYTAPSGGAAVTNLNSFTIAQNNATICRTGTTAACGSATATATTSTTVTATINTPATASEPLQTIYFYYVHPGADNTIGTADDYLVMFASVPAPTDPVQTGNTARVYSAAATLTAASLPNTGSYRVVAIGANSTGDAITSNVVGLTVN